MSDTGSGPKRPQPVSVEEWDDDTQDSVPGTRITANANVAVKRDLTTDSHLPSSLGGYKHDGTDSGYASKAPTVSSMASSPRRRNSELKIDTAVPFERKRNPYAMTATTTAPPPTAAAVSGGARRPSMVRRPTMETKEDPKPVKKPFCHQKGLCWVCDKYDFHFDPKNPPESMIRRMQQSKATASTPTAAASKSQQQQQQTRRQSQAQQAPQEQQQPKQQQQQLPPQSKSQPQTQPTQTKTLVTVAKAKAEERPQSRRQSSAGQPRPQMVYSSTPIHTGPYPQYPVGWAAPGMPHMGVSYAQVPYMAPGTPVNYMPPSSYYPQFDAPPVFEDYPPQQPHQQMHQPPPQQQHMPQPPRPSRRTSMAGHERHILERRPSRPSNMLERTVSRDQRPQITSQKSNRNIQADKIAMPPPSRPVQPSAPVHTDRPRQHRSSTYDPHVSSQRRRSSAVYDYSDEESESESSEEEFDPRAAMVVSRQPPPSPRRPPSSYKAPQDAERPPLKVKSRSYDDGSQQVHVSKSSRSEVTRRRTTESVPSAILSDPKEQAANAYIEKKSGPHVDLTAENLKSLKANAVRKHHDQMSESGSTTSHVTHHSSSKDSSNGRGRMAPPSARAASMNININGLNLNITDGSQGQNDTPVRLDVAGVQISMNNKENLDYYKRPMKQLERTPSMSSRPSRRSLTQSLVSAATAGQRRENEVLAIESGREPRESREYTRRPSLLDEEQREHLRAMSARAARRTSQAMLDDEEREKLRMISAKSSRQGSRVRAPEDRIRSDAQSTRSSIDYSL